MAEGQDFDARAEGIEEKLRELASQTDDDAALALLEEAVEEIESMGTEMEGNAECRGEADGGEGKR